MIKILKVKIKKVSWERLWYNGAIGNIYIVVKLYDSNHDFTYMLVNDDGVIAMYIEADDAEVLEEIRHWR